MEMEKIMENHTESSEIAVADSEKRAKFQAESKERMAKICTQIGYLEKIASKRSVDYTKENVERMFAYLESQLADCKATFLERFEPEKDGKNFDFEF